MANEPLTTALDLDFRPQATLWIALGGLLLVAPFALLHFVEGRTGLGLAAVGVIVVLCFNAWYLRRRPGRVPTLAPRLLVALFGLSLCAYLLLTQGMSGMLWCYPTVLWLYCTLPQRHARLSNVILLAFSLPLIPLVATPDVALRAVATLIGVSLFSAVLLHVITRQQEHLREQLLSDPLTGLRNRHLLVETVERAMSCSNRDGMPVSLLVMDIDHFKRVNDDFGHAAGDDVLRGVGALLRHWLRTGDVAFRLGGEEFLVLLHGVERTDACRLAETLLAELRGTPLLEGRRVTASIGLATFDGDPDAQRWMAQADKALYRAKNTGRDRVAVGPAGNIVPIGGVPVPDAPEGGRHVSAAPERPSTRDAKRVSTRA